MRKKKVERRRSRKKGRKHFKKLTRVLSVIHEVERYDKTFDITCFGEAPLNTFLDELNLQSITCGKHHGSRGPTKMSRIFEVVLPGDGRSSPTSTNTNNTMRSPTSSFRSRHSGMSLAQSSLHGSPNDFERSGSPVLLSDSRRTTKAHSGSLVHSPRTSGSTDQDVDSRQTPQGASAKPLLSHFSDGDVGDARRPTRHNSSGSCGGAGDNQGRASGHDTAMDNISALQDAENSAADELTSASFGNNSPSSCSTSCVPQAVHCLNDSFTLKKNLAADRTAESTGEEQRQSDAVASSHEACSNASGSPRAELAQSLHVPDNPGKSHADQADKFNVALNDLDASGIEGRTYSRYTKASNDQAGELVVELSTLVDPVPLHSCSLSEPVGAAPLTDLRMPREIRAFSLNAEQTGRLGVPPLATQTAASSQDNSPESGQSLQVAQSSTSRTSFPDAGLNGRVSQLSSISGRMTRGLTSRALHSVCRLFKRRDRVKVTFAWYLIDAMPQHCDIYGARARHAPPAKYVVLPQLTPVMARRQAILYFFDVKNRASLHGFSPLSSQINNMDSRTQPFCYMVGVHPSQENTDEFRSGSTVEDAQLLCDAVGAQLYHVEPFENEGWATELVRDVLRHALAPPPATTNPRKRSHGFLSMLKCCGKKNKKLEEVPYD